MVHGQAAFSSLPNALNVTNSPGAIINWNSFGIDPNEVTRFVQQSSASAVLNRVVGQDPSAILGQLLSNGRVFLINPNGIVFGPNSVVDTAGLVASSLGISDEDFLSGNYRFEGGPDAGRVDNQGLIKVGADGGIFLLAPNIKNSGIIQTDGGSLVLAAGQKVTLASLDSEGVTFELQAPENEVINLGSMLTNGGAAAIFAGTIQHSGTINADSVRLDAEGRVQLYAQRNITIDEDALISASGEDGGSVTVQSESGTSWQAGRIEAIGLSGNGGDVQLLGEQVALAGNASIDVTGETGGGEVLIGGDYKGEGNIQTASVAFMAEEVSVSADALNNGDGGKVILWADNATGFHGTISARVEKDQETVDLLKRQARII